MTGTGEQLDAPAAFVAAVRSVRATDHRPELDIVEIAAPQGVAPHAFALAADVSTGRFSADAQLGAGRFVLLHDPAEPEPWSGPFRVVCYAQAPLDVELAVDPLMAEVAWSWLVDALDDGGASYAAASGTATKTLSNGFGDLAEQGAGATLELRASWSPTDDDLGAHVAAWGELLCMLAGLPPASAEGVSSLTARRNARA